jgi:hypothetical protein
MLAEAFARVRFPIIPVLHQDKTGKVRMLDTNSKLVTPRDFDHSPYFDVIKYPVLDFDELGIYRSLPWDQTGVDQHSHTHSRYTHPDELQALTPISSSESISASSLTTPADYPYARGYAPGHATGGTGEKRHQARKHKQADADEDELALNDKSQAVPAQTG